MNNYRYFLSGVIYTNTGYQGAFNTEISRKERINGIKEVMEIETELLTIMKEQNKVIEKICVTNFILF